MKMNCSSLMLCIVINQFAKICKTAINQNTNEYINNSLLKYQNTVTKFGIDLINNRDLFSQNNSHTLYIWNSIKYQIYPFALLWYKKLPFDFEQFIFFELGTSFLQ